MTDLPEPYIDCILTKKDGSKRIGRYSVKGYFELASYQYRNVAVVWAVKDVVSWEEIEY